jgi:hypothetical protein
MSVAIDHGDQPIDAAALDELAIDLERPARFGRGHVRGELRRGAR